jgi:hypothetical protein
MAIRTPRGGKDRTASGDNSSLKIMLKGRDNAPLSMRELRETALDALLKLAEYETGYRAKSATLYVTMVDENGTVVRINRANELTIYAYKAAAEEHGL